MSNSEWKLYTVTYDHKQRSLSFTDLPYNNWRNIIMPEVAINPVLAALSVSLSLLLKCKKLMYKININFIL